MKVISFITNVIFWLHPGNLFDRYQGNWIFCSSEVFFKYYVHCVQCLLLDRHGSLTGEAFIFFLTVSRCIPALEEREKTLSYPTLIDCHHLYAPSSIEAMIDRGERDP